MPVDYKTFLGILAAAIGFVAYFPYLRDMFRGWTKPHPFSWLGWGTLETVAFIAQLIKGGGAGTYVTGLSAAFTMFIGCYALAKRKQIDIRASDTIAFGGALIGIILWMLTDDPLLAVIFVTTADALSFIPTFRKAYHHPASETLIEFELSAIKFIPALFALASYSLTTWLYPTSLILTNTAFVIMVRLRRRVLKTAIQ